MFLLPIPVQTYHFYKWRNTQHNIGSPPSRFSFTWVCALHPIDDGQLQVKQSTAGLTFCICSATHICCFDIGDQQKLKNPGYPDFLHKNKRERERLFFRFPVFDRFSSVLFHNLFSVLISGAAVPQNHITPERVAPSGTAVRSIPFNGIHGAIRHILNKTDVIRAAVTTPCKENNIARLRCIAPVLPLAF